MGVDYSALRKVLNSSRMNIKKYANGKSVVSDSSRFRGMNLSALEEAQAIVEQGIKEDTYRFAKKCGISKVDGLKDCNDRATRIADAIVDLCKGGKQLSSKEIFERAKSASGIRDSIFNPRMNLSNSVDPSRYNVALPNIYISPFEACTLYSQKGIFETVINKKSKSILLNGITVKNPRFDLKQLNKIKEKLDVLNFKDVLSDAVRDSLVYGGSLCFPMFKKDTPLTTNLPLSSLLKLGVLGKDCIDYFVHLDRWNTFIIPPYNPTQKDFLTPEVFTVPFLGSDVHSSRCGRVVTSEQAGYLGKVINHGWGISDFLGYLQSGLNYKVTMQSIPMMIQQMSILARVINVDGVLASEGSNALDALVEDETIRVRETSLDNPVSLDVMGDLRSIDRNFDEVPDLIKLLRQDFASDATIPEPMLFSSEKGAFASGDDISGNMDKQWESVKMIHKEVEHQVKQLVKIVIIDTLGASGDVIKALPYTSIKFDEPLLASALERAQIGKYYADNIFNLVSSHVPLDIAVDIANRYTSEDVSATTDIVERLKGIQEKQEIRDEINFNIEQRQKELMLEQMEAQTRGQEISNEVAASGGQLELGLEGGKVSSNANLSSKISGKDLFKSKGRKYSKLEQKQHEQVRLGSSKRDLKLNEYKNSRL